MFYYLTGKIALMDVNLAVVDCGGVGFRCQVTSYTQSQLKVGQEHRLYTYCNIREDAFDIFGFATREELRCFELLIGVSGVGPKAALAILSAVTPEQFKLGVMAGDEKALTRAPGVGKKLAQRILLELKDKLGGQLTETGQTAAAASMLPQQNNKIALVVAALAELGYSQAEIAGPMKALQPDSMSVEEMVRQVLRAMVTG